MTVEARPPVAATLPWEKVRDRVTRFADPPARAANAFAFATAKIPPLDELRRYAEPSFPAEGDVVRAALDLTARIRRDFVYDGHATTVSTPLIEVLTNRRGVCQDFAHLQIGCLHAMGLPARYVSGYLRTIPPPGRARLIGADASHAWVSVWCGEEWLDLDPTNGRTGSTDHVTLAWGRDYDDVSPVRGVMLGGPRQSLEVSVDVAPVEALP